jgi:hypothetical protein
MEQIIEEHEEMKKEHRQYLACPVNYWEGVRTTPQAGRGRPNLSWLFPMYLFFFSFQTIRLFTRRL